MKSTFPIQVRTLRGLEPLLVEELKALGALNLSTANRVVHCQGDLRFLYQANLSSRLAIRVLRHLESFPAANEKQLYQGIRKIDWSPWLKPTGTLAVDAHVYSSFSTHSLYISQLVKDAIADQFREKLGKRPSVQLDNPDLRISLSLFENQAQILLDSSNESLHKRGYRLKAGEAPVNEVLAAGIIQLSGWKGESPFIDPMTGSGTLCIEAGLALRKIAPGLLRKSFGFEKWKDYDAKLFKELLAKAQGEVQLDKKAEIIGIEIDPQVAKIARENVKRAGLDDLIRIETGDFFSWDEIPKTPGVLVMNPPYDERLSLENSAVFSENIGDRLKQVYGGWKAFILQGNLEAAKFIGLKTTRKTVLYNGALECRLLEYDIRAASGKGKGPGWRSKNLEANPLWEEKAQVFTNRLKKNFKHLSKQAKRENKNTFRIYDWDIPEFPFILDWVDGQVVFTEIPRNQGRNLIEQGRYIKFMITAAASALEVTPDKIVLKK